ncbi:MAG: endonuclease III [Halobacteria archaeon]
MECESFDVVVETLYGEYDPEFRVTEPWEELVMTVLSQNTSDENRDVAYERLEEEYSTPREILEADIEEVKELIAPAGLYNSKARYLRNAARYVVEERDGETEWIRSGEMEEVYNELVSVKGIGHKTADVILLFSTDAQICPVDTHVDRVTARLGVSDGLTRRKTRDRLLELHDECGVNLRKAHVALIAHGRETCTARNPDCVSCVVEDVCEKVGAGEDDGL